MKQHALLAYVIEVARQVLHFKVGKLDALARRFPDTASARGLRPAGG